MDRFGVFVDAAISTRHPASFEMDDGSSKESRLRLDIRGSKGTGRERLGSVHLRTYWYDGARDAIPTAQHLVVANLPGVKLRLGRLTLHGQKGVDSRIVRDLIILRLTSDLDCLSDWWGRGPEEGVSEAQERGVRVDPWALSPTDEQNLSPTLAMEADDVLVLNRAFTEPHFKVRAPDVAVEVERDDPTNPTASRLAFAVAWSEAASDDELSEAVEALRLSIPPEIDRQILAYGVRVWAVVGSRTSLSGCCDRASGRR